MGTVNEEIRHERELREQWQTLAEKALRLQADEYERRLDALNHEFARANEERARVVSSATWNEFRKGFEEWKIEVNNFKSNMQGRMAIIALVYGALLLAAVRWLV